MIAITCGMLKAFDECPQKYNLYYNENIEIPSDNTDALIGQKIHALINYKFKNYDIQKIVESLQSPENNLLNVLWQNFLSFNIQRVDFSEYTFQVPLNEKFLLNGRVDAIRKINDMYEILDWKTGKAKNIDTVNDLQTITYLFSIYKLFEHLNIISSPDNLCMTYYFLKEKVYKTINFSSEKYLEYEKILLTKSLSLSKFASLRQTKSQKCLKCPLNIVCEWAYNQ
jgi:hypothetical protein